jgi:hypothetical protein
VPGPAPARRGRRRLAVSLVFLAAALLSSGYLVLFSPGQVAPDPSATVAAPATTAAPPTPSPEPPPTTAPPLSLPGDFPTDGPGEVRYARGTGEEIGSEGRLVRFRVAVETNIDEDPGEVARFIEATLKDPRGWTADGRTRFQRVPGDAAHEVTVSLVTSGTAARMCATAGLDIIGTGLPDGGLSCHYSGQVVLNLSRWRMSVPEYVAAKVPLERYRQMVVNHEIGHALGYGHEGCPGPGELAPVMQQQSISLDGCRPNPWPFPDE